MSFFRIQSQHHLANTANACKVSLTRLCGRAKGKNQVGLRLAIGANIIRALDAVIGDRLDLMWGCEDDFGQVLLVKAERGVTIKKTRESRYEAGYLTFVGLPRQPVTDANDGRWSFLAQPVSAVSVEWEARDDGVSVSLPATWWEQQPTSAATEKLKALAAVPMPPARTVEDFRRAARVQGAFT